MFENMETPSCGVAWSCIDSHPRILLCLFFRDLNIMPEIVLYPPVESERLDRIRAAAQPLTVINAQTEEEARTAIRTADAFFGKITPDLLQETTCLRWVQSPTASLEHYLFPELIAHPCLLSNMRGLFSDVIADQVLGYILCFARQLPRYIRQQMRHQWEPAGGESARSDFKVGPGQLSSIDLAHQHLADCSLGIVGVGEIGREIARRAAAFGMTIRGVDPHPRAIDGVRAEIWDNSRLPDLLAVSDYVVIAAPHTPETVKLFRRETIALMKPTARLINIGRGVIVDLQDLTEALQQQIIAGAALDVFETEPLPADHPLWEMENVILTPHIAGFSPRVPERHLRTLLENISRFARGETPGNLVDKTRWY